MGIERFDSTLIDMVEDNLILQESSIPGDAPGLWNGSCHLSHTEVAELTAYLQHWLKTGRLFGAKR